MNIRFSHGQEIVCVLKTGWMDQATQDDVSGPKYNEVVTCDGYNVENAAYLMLKEYVWDNEGNRSYFPGQYFEPLINTEQLLEELESSPISVEA